MQRRIEITVSQGETDEVVRALGGTDGLLGLQVQRGASLDPPGDAISAVFTNRGLHRAVALLHRRGIGLREGTSFTTNDLASVVAPAVIGGTGRETSDLTWEEAELEMGKEGNMTGNALLLMAVSGAVAALGLALDTLHLVVGAMIIAPGFVPITRVSMGLVTQGDAWRRGLLDVLKGYVALVAGAVGGSVCLLVMGYSLSAEGTYLPTGSLFDYWTTITAPGLLVSALAGAAGATLIISDRSVLTSGVLITLALIPTAALMGVALVGGDLGLLGLSAARWSADVVLVALTALPIFFWHARRVKRRSSML